MNEQSASLRLVVEHPIAGTPWRYHNPVAVTFGAGSLQQLREIVGTRTAVLVTFPEAESLGLVGRVKALLGAQVLAVIADVAPNPDVASLRSTYEHEILQTLPRLVDDLHDIGLRTRIARAALMAGLAFSNTRTALAHSISYEMTLRHGLPHGLACSFTLAMVMSRAIGLRRERDALLAQIFGENLQGAPQRLADFLEGLGVSTRFESYGVGSEEAQRMVAHALEGARGRNFIGSASASNV